MFKFKQMVLMLCFILSGALCYANTKIEKDGHPVSIELKESTGCGGSDRSSSINPIDSALGKGYELCPSGENVVSWGIEYLIEEPFQQYHEKLWKEHYQLTIYYGLKHGGSLPGSNDE